MMEAGLFAGIVSRDHEIGDVKGGATMRLTVD